MFNNPLIFKAVGGTVVLGGAAGTAYVFRDNLLGALGLTDNLHTYWVEKTTATTVAAATATTNTPTLYTNETTKNFWCQKEGDKGIDKTCEIFDLKEQKTNQSISFSDISKEKTLVKDNTKITDTKYYQLKINIKNLKSNGWDMTKPINVNLIEAKENGTHVFSTLKLVLRIDNLSKNKKNHMVLGKSDISSDVTVSDNGSFKCKFGEDSKTTFSCLVYKFGDTAVSDKESLNFSQFEIVSGSIAANTSKNTYYGISFLGEEIKNLSQSDMKKNVIFAKTADNTTKITFTFQAFLFGNIDSTTKTNTRIAII